MAPIFFFGGGAGRNAFKGKAINWGASRLNGTGFGYPDLNLVPNAVPTRVPFLVPNPDPKGFSCTDPNPDSFSRPATTLLCTDQISLLPIPPCCTNGTSHMHFRSSPPVGGPLALVSSPFRTLRLPFLAPVCSCRRHQDLKPIMGANQK